MRNAILFKAADDRVLGSASLDMAGAEGGQQETLVGTGFSVLASQGSSRLWVFLYGLSASRQSLRCDAL